MNTIKVRALKQHVYADIPRKVGEIYDATDDVLATLIAVGFAKVLEEVIETRVEEAATKGQYERRDMRARK